MKTAVGKYVNCFSLGVKLSSETKLELNKFFKYAYSYHQFGKSTER